MPEAAFEAVFDIVWRACRGSWARRCTERKPDRMRHRHPPFGKDGSCMESGFMESGLMGSGFGFAALQSLGDVHAHEAIEFEDLGTDTACACYHDNGKNDCDHGILRGS